MPDDIVITGMGIMSPIGCNEHAFWEGLCQGRSGAAPIDCLDTTELTRKIACQVREPVDAGRPLGRAAHLAVLAARQAVHDAGLAQSERGDERIATIRRFRRQVLEMLRLEEFEHIGELTDQLRRLTECPYCLPGAH